MRAFRGVVPGLEEEPSRPWVSGGWSQVTEGNPQNKEDRQTPQALQKHQLCPHAGHAADTGSRLALEPLTGGWSSSGLKALAHLGHILSPLPPPPIPRAKPEVGRSLWQGELLYSAGQTERDNRDGKNLAS